MKRIDISDQTAVSMPMRNLISILAAVGLGVWAYFGIIERLNSIETNYILISGDIEKNTDFRIKWPLGELGALPDDAQQFMRIDHIDQQLDKIHNKLEAGMHNKVNIDRLQKDVDKMMSDIEKLKDKIRDNKGTKENGM